MTECVVVGCVERGKGQICLWDGQFHHHGRIHYDCEAGKLDAELAGIEYKNDGWHYLCDTHYRALKEAREKRKATI